LSLPLGWKSYRDHERNAASAVAATADAAAPTTAAASTFAPAPSDTEDERPTRLN
jgi:CDP-diacylglycerol--serine O-phosphatidyltransferase